MAGTWSLRIGPEVHGGLTLMRLEGLVRSGTVEGHHLVCSDGKWMRVDEVPYLKRQIEIRKQLMSAILTPPAKRSGRVRIGNVVHLFPETSLSKLQLPSDEERNRRIRLLGRLIAIAAVLVLIAEACFLFSMAWSKL
jgi:hypothetical protein